jgi:hypothetical protein
MYMGEPAEFRNLQREAEFTGNISMLILAHLPVN